VPIRLATSPPPARRTTAGRGRLRVGWWLGLLGLAGSAAAEPVLLQPSLTLLEQLPPALRGKTPTTVEGQRIEGKVDEVTVVEGAAVLRRHDVTVRADRLEHHATDDTALASGGVRIHRQGDVYEGARLQLKLDTFEGRFDDVRFQFLRTGGQARSQPRGFSGREPRGST
jgi:LPS-assembly protein